MQIGIEINNAFLEKDERKLKNCLNIAQSLRDECVNPDEVAVLEILYW